MYKDKEDLAKTKSTMDPSHIDKEIITKLTSAKVNIIDPSSIERGEFISEFNNKIYQGKLKSKTGETDVALKEFSKRDYFKCIDAYVNEAKKFNQIPDINSVPKVLGMSVTDECVYIIKELLPGARSLATIYHELDKKQKINYLMQLTNVLGEFHSRNKSYQNLLPLNVLVSNNKIYLVDFGGSKLVIGSSINPKDPKSKPYYMPPEYFTQDDDEVGEEEVDGEKIRKDPPTSFDIWSLGCIISEVLSETKPWTNIDWEDPEVKAKKPKKRIPLEDTTIMNLLTKGVKFPIPNSLDEDIIDLLKRNMVEDPTQRMTYQEIYNALVTYFNKL